MLENRRTTYKKSFGKRNTGTFVEVTLTWFLCILNNSRYDCNYWFVYQLF